MYYWSAGQRILLTVILIVLLWAIAHWAGL